MALSKNWRAEAKLPKPQAFPCKSLGVDIIVRPMSALRRTKIEKAYPFDDDGKRDGVAVTAALVADSIVDDAGSTIFTVDDLLGDEVGSVAFLELQEIVSPFIFPVTPKNSIPATVSPTA